MSVFKKAKKEESGAYGCASAGELCAKGHPFSQFERYSPLLKPENHLYDAIREAVPVVDAALCKINALVSGFSIKCSDREAQNEIESFLNNVPAGGINRGLDAFVSQYLDQLLMYGTAVGEMILSPGRSGVSAVCVGELDNIELEKTGACGARVWVREAGGKRPVKYQELLLLSALSPKPGQVTGTSLLKGLPFVTDVLLKIYNTIGINFERIGNVRFAVTYKPSSSVQAQVSAGERARMIADEWSKAMRQGQNGSVSDFVAVGDVDIKVIGADNQVLDCEVPARLMLEQIVAKTGIPPFMLGLNWSSTERMSTQQADILTTELWRYRRILTPVISKVCNTHLRLCGYRSDARIVWDDISLQDEVELAKAQLIRMQAQQIADKLGMETSDAERAQ